MKNTLLYLILSFALCLSGCKKYDDDIDRLNNRLDNLENTQILSINQQINAINSSLNQFKTTQKELGTYIKTLQTTASDLQNKINSINSQIADLEIAFGEDIDAAKAEILAQLAAVKSELESELNQINSAIITLQEEDKTLDSKISNLRTYVNEELSENKDWTSATFATLEQFNSLAKDVAQIDKSITTVKISIETLETKLRDEYTAAIEDAVANLSSDVAEGIKEAITSITESYITAISTAKEEIEEAYTAAIAKAVAALETSMQKWINEKFAGYYTIAETDANLANQKAEMEAALLAQKIYLEELIEVLSEGDGSGFDPTDINAAIEANAKVIADNAKEIAQLQKDLATTKAEIITAYTTAIETAINTLDGKITRQIASELATINTRIDTEVATINNVIESLTARVKTIENTIKVIQDEIGGIKNQITELLEQIQSITYIPTQSDGCVRMNYELTSDKYIPKTATLLFELKPNIATAKLVEIWKNALTIKAVYTTNTRAQIGDFTTLDIVNVRSSGGILTIEVSGEKLDEKFFLGQIAASISLEISNGINSISSIYIPLTPILSGDMEGEEVTYDQLLSGHLPASNNWIITDKTILGKPINGWGVPLPYNTIMITCPNTSCFGDEIFFRCSGIALISMPKAISIGYDAFRECHNLRIVSLPSATSIGDRGFMECNKLTSISLPSVTSIGESVFRGCSALSSVSLPSATSICSGVFQACTSLKKLEIATKSKLMTLSPEQIFYLFGGVNTTDIDLTIGSQNEGIDIETRTWNGITFKSITVK